MALKKKVTNFEIEPTEYFAMMSCPKKNNNKKIKKLKNKVTWFLFFNLKNKK